jgi:hypothetical protein
MHITITRSFRHPVAMNSDITPTFPTPVSSGPDVPRTCHRLYFDYPFRWRLRCNDFNVLMLNRTPLMNDPLLHTAGRCEHHRQ